MPDRIAIAAIGLLVLTAFADITASANSKAERYLEAARFMTHQPRVLEQIGAHHAYARGLTGRGVRIGIDDTIVDYTQTGEFGNRVKLRDWDGAVLSYSRPYGDYWWSEVQSCVRYRFGFCEWWRANSYGDSEARNRWVQQLVRQRGWPTRDDSLFIVDEYYSAYDPLDRLFRWLEVPTPYSDPGAPPGSGGSHGTWVASNAAGKNLGVAPGATIIPTARNLTNDQDEAEAATRALRLFVQGLPTAVRQQLDRDLAADERARFAKFDIINHSWGAPGVRGVIFETIEDVRWFMAYLPNSLNAIWQTDRPDAEKTIRVWAAGNIPPGAPPNWPYQYPSLGALLPYGAPEVRGHWIAVVATDPKTRAIHPHSHRCGPLPPNWNAARHGPHYCLAAPGVTRGLVPNPNSPGRGRVESGFGTSYAAPLVSGSLALLMEHFRGTRGNTEIVKRMLDTADRSGRYADSATYGAGHLDLEAALTPVGMVSVGQSGHALSSTAFHAPAAYGAVGQRVGSLELATFDEQDFPFWIPVSGLVSAGGTSRSPIPVFPDTDPTPAPAVGLDGLGAHWLVLSGDRADTMGGTGWSLGLTETSASMARTPDSNGWGYGFSYEARGHLDAKASGAFGSDLRSGMIWATRSFRHDLGGRWAVKGAGTLALDVPRYEGDAIFRASPSMMSAVSVRVGTENLGFTVEQPLRAETGTGTFRVENGRIENGRRLHDTYRVPLRPGAREVRMTLRHEREALAGRVALEAAVAVNAGHVPGERDASAGVAYRIVW